MRLLHHSLTIVTRVTIVTSKQNSFIAKKFIWLTDRLILYLEMIS